MKLLKLVLQLFESIYVKPKFSEISKFCTDLTKITQDTVKDASFFDVALPYLIDHYDFRNRLIFSWGDYDQNQFIQNCEMFNVKPAFKSWFNLKALFAIKNGHTKEVGVQKAIDIKNLTFEGQHHSGKDDAFNIAKLFLTVF